jgi:hypothetical protein
MNDLGGRQRAATQKAVMAVRMKPLRNSRNAPCADRFTRKPNEQAKKSCS